MMTNLTPALSKIRLFKPLTKDTVQQLVEKMDQKELKAGEFLFRSGDPSDGLYIVADGHLDIVFENPNPAQDDLVVASLKPGDVLGEISLLDRQARAASAKAIAKTTVKRLSVDTFNAVIAEQPQEITKEIREISEDMRLEYMVITLRKLDLFQGLNDELLRYLGTHVQSITLKEGEVLFERGTPGDKLYMVTSGWLEIFVTSPRGEDLILNHSGPGEAIGEIALLDNAARTASVRGITDAHLLTLDRKEYIEFITKHPVAALETTRNINQRLRLATTYLEQLGDWSRQVAEGEYDKVLKEVKSEQTRIVHDTSNEERVTQFLSSFFSSIEAIKKREDKLKSEVLRLRIQIDEGQRDDDVEEITNTSFFTELQTNIGQLRAQLREELEEAKKEDDN